MNSKLKKLTFLLIPLICFAQQQVSELMLWIQDIAYYLAGLFIVVGAYKIVTSEGDPRKMEEGKRAVLFAIIGLGVAYSARSICNLMGC